MNPLPLSTGRFGSSWLVRTARRALGSNEATIWLSFVKFDQTSSSHVRTVVGSSWLDFQPLNNHRQSSLKRAKERRRANYHNEVRPLSQGLGKPGVEKKDIKHWILELEKPFVLSNDGEGLAVRVEVRASDGVVKDNQRIRVQFSELFQTRKRCCYPARLSVKKASQFLRKHSQDDKQTGAMTDQACKECVEWAFFVWADLQVKYENFTSGMKGGHHLILLKSSTHSHATKKETESSYVTWTQSGLWKWGPTRFT